MKTSQLINPIAGWNHRVPSLVAATVVTGILLAGIAALANPDVESAQSPLVVATQSKVTG
jgi:hypothetical protein